MTQLDEYMQRHYSTIVVPQESTDGIMVYLAYHPELPGCMSHGDTPEEAMENLQEARALYFESLLEEGLAIPDPQIIRRTIGSGGTATSVVWRVIPVNPRLKDSAEIQYLAVPSVAFVNCK